MTEATELKPPFLRPHNETADSLIGVKIPCLDHGFVYLVDYMGDDRAIVQAARVSYGEGTKRSRSDRGLINYLLRNDHTTPFEMVEIKFHMKLPIFVARQLIRHRTASVNEVSGRYSQLPGEFYLPRDEDINFQSKSNRQGRSTDEVPREIKEKFLRVVKAIQEGSYADYLQFLEEDLAKELARIGLPVSIYTEWYWKVDLHNLLHFLKLRLDPHAQKEIRVFAEAIAQIVSQLVPLAWRAFEEYQLHARKLSRSEREIIGQALREILGDRPLQIKEKDAVDYTGWKEEFEKKIGHPIEIIPA